MNIMQIASNSSYPIGSGYSIKLNDKEVLIVEDDPQSKSLHDAKKVAKDKEQKIEKSMEKEKASKPQNLSPQQEEQVKELQSRDAEVKAHEAAHQSAAGGLAGAASYTYQQGPDGKMYAIGGEVPISIPSSASPKEALANARKVQAAATAPGEPSSQDMAVASSAAMMQVKAEQQLAQQAQKEQRGNDTYANLENTLQTQRQQPLDISA